MSHASQPGDKSDAIDPRIVRTRQMLIDAIGKLLRQKSFEDISVQEIVNEAKLTRATFYLHYPDKNALLQAMTALRFSELIARRGLTFTDCDGALRAIALSVCDYLAESTECPEQLAKMPLDGSVIPVIKDMFLKGAAEHRLDTDTDTDTELLATAAAWAIFGSARNWFQTPNRIPAEEMAAKIESMVKPIFLARPANSAS